MTDTTPAAAAPAAIPAAAPAAPVPASAPVPAAPVAATPAVPTAPVAAPAAPVAASAESLLPSEPVAPAAAPQTDAEKITAARELVKQAEIAADPNSGQAWLLAEGVMGQGERPGWLNVAKYKSVTDQAKAYPELEKRFGAFTGAPKNEKGEVTYTVPAEVPLKVDHPMAQAFTKWATENQLSQDGYNHVLGQLNEFLVAQSPKRDVIMARLGDKAQERIDAVAAWGKANLGDGYEMLREATKGANADVVIGVIEQLIGKTAQARMPKPGPDVVGAATGGGLEQIQKDHGARLADGRLRANVEPAYRLEIDKRYRDYYAGLQG